MSTKLFIKIFVALMVCLFIGFMASLAKQTGMSDWYPGLNKPWFNPPSWIFGPVWGVLYVMMGIAAGIVWSKGTYHKWVKTALYHFAFQLMLNGAWSLLFFGLKEPFWALLDIIALFVLIILTIRWFRVVSNTAALLLIPYAVWVLFAGILNFEIWRLN